jgi:hypothetical protein
MMTQDALTPRVYRQRNTGPPRTISSHRSSLMALEVPSHFRPICRPVTIERRRGHFHRYRRRARTEHRLARPSRARRGQGSGQLWLIDRPRAGSRQGWVSPFRRRRWTVHGDPTYVTRPSTLRSRPSEPRQLAIAEKPRLELTNPSRCLRNRSRHVSVDPSGRYRVSTAPGYL